MRELDQNSANAKLMKAAMKGPWKKPNPLFRFGRGTLRLFKNRFIHPVIIDIHQILCSSCVVSQQSERNKVYFHTLRTKTEAFSEIRINVEYVF